VREVWATAVVASDAVRRERRNGEVCKWDVLWLIGSRLVPGTGREPVIAGAIVVPCKARRRRQIG
jgi:hypothetical protein